MTESNQGPATPGTAARCEICERESCLRYAGFPSAADDCYRAGYERMQRQRDALYNQNVNMAADLYAAREAGLISERLKAENASLRAAAFENRPDRVLLRQVDHAVAAEQRAEAAEKERDGSRRIYTNYSARLEAMRAERDAAEQRNTELEGALRAAKQAIEWVKEDDHAERPLRASTVGRVDQALHLVDAALHDEERRLVEEK